jgi:hypothetical protein
MGNKLNKDNRVCIISILNKCNFVDQEYGYDICSDTEGEYLRFKLIDENIIYLKLNSKFQKSQGSIDEFKHEITTVNKNILSFSYDCMDLFQLSIKEPCITTIQECINIAHALNQYKQHTLNIVNQ